VVLAQPQGRHLELEVPFFRKSDENLGDLLDEIILVVEDIVELRLLLFFSLNARVLDEDTNLILLDQGSDVAVKSLDYFPFTVKNISLCDLDIGSNLAEMNRVLAITVFNLVLLGEDLIFFQEGKGWKSLRQ